MIVRCRRCGFSDPIYCYHYCLPTPSIWARILTTIRTLPNYLMRWPDHHPRRWTDEE